jgi:hypothetical protein
MIGFDLPSHTVVVMLLTRLDYRHVRQTGVFCPLDGPEVGQSGLNQVWHVGM